MTSRNCVSVKKEDRSIAAMAVSNEKSYSQYFQHLDSTARGRYEEKLQILGDIEDPYVRSDSSGTALEWHDWPDVEFPDIYSYLIAAPSPYTNEELKAYKSMDGYKCVTNGWIEKVQVAAIPTRPSTVLVHARVRHSQRVAATPLKPWVAVEKSGVIVCAHCDCMAGLGEACSHIAAVLFALEANTQIKKSMSCTSLPCTWLPPSFQSVTYAPTAEIDFKQKKQSEPSTVKMTEMPDPNEEELQSLYRDLAADKPALLSLVPGFSDDYMPLSEKGVLPKPLTDLYKAEYVDLAHPDLLAKCEEIYSTVTVTSEEASNIEENTRGQSTSKLWFQQRAGRVTASRLKAAVKTNVAKPSQSLVKSICYPESTQFWSKATAWGCAHEKDARIQYVSEMANEHPGFSLSECGLIVNPAWPFLGASPDGVINCTCCGMGVLEIKCPYICKDKSFLDASKEHFFLCQSNGNMTFDTTHTYFYQVQAQIELCGAKYCDFVVWSGKEVHTERIYPNKDFIKNAFDQALNFIKVGVLPELVGKWFSKTPGPMYHTTNVATTSTLTEVTTPTLIKSAAVIPTEDMGKKLYCICQQEESGRIIACDNEACPVTWFHVACLQMQRIPKGKWYCDECRKTK